MNLRKALEEKIEEAHAKAQPLKTALKALIVKSEIIETQIKQKQSDQYEAYVEEQSSSRLETWVTSNIS